MIQRPSCMVECKAVVFLDTISKKDQCWRIARGEEVYAFCTQESIV